MSARRRSLTIVASSAAALVLGPAIYFGAILDFDAYVMELRRERAVALRELRDAPEPPFRSRRSRLLTTEEVEAVAHAFRAAGLLDPVVQVGAAIQYWMMRDPERYARGIEYLAEQRGLHARVIVALNSWRIDDAHVADMERRRPAAEAQLARLDEHQRHALDNAWDEHGVALVGGLPRVGEALRPARLSAELRRLSQALASAPVEGRTPDALADRLDTLVDAGGQVVDEAELLGCSFHVDVDREGSARLVLACPGDDGEPGSGETSLAIEFPDAGDAPAAPDAGVPDDAPRAP